jgi:predicted O-methyltransferase YrrM
MKFKFCIFVNDLSIQASSDRDTSTYRFRPVDLTSAPYNVLPLYTTLYHLPELSITKQLIIVSATKNKSLNEYLKEHGFNLSPLNSETNEGYSSDAQREVFAEELKKIQPKRILEIGFNAGHSCEVFLESNQETSITVFDINMHSYTHFGVEFMKRKYLNRFQFVQGDSLKTVPFYAMNHSEKFDLIFIDGCHSFDYAVKDIYHCKRLAHSKSVLWIDDYAPYGVQGAVDYCVSRGLIELIEIKSVHDWAGVRSWVKAKYKK